MMSKGAGFEFARQLEEAGVEASQAAAIVEIVERIVGEPLTNEAFEAHADIWKAQFEAFKAEVSAKLDVNAAKMNGLDEKIGDKLAALTEKFDLRERAFEKSIEAQIAKGRLWLLGAAWTAAIAVLVGVGRFLIWGLP